MADYEIEYPDEESNQGEFNQTWDDGQSRALVQSNLSDELSTNTSNLAVTPVPPSGDRREMFSSARDFEVSAGSLNNAQTINHYNNCVVLPPTPQRSENRAAPRYPAHDGAQEFENRPHPQESQLPSSQRPELHPHSSQTRQSRTFRDADRHTSEQDTRDATASRSGHPQRTGAATTMYAPLSPPPSPQTRWRFCPSGLSTVDLYVKLMLPRFKAYPMWCPSPNLAPHIPEAHRRDGISMGDVGLITADGLFDFIFNIFVDGDHPLNVDNVPEGFSPCSWSNRLENSDMPPGSTISTDSIYGNAASLPMLEPSPFHLTVLDSPGAICVLPFGAHTSKIADPDEIVESYIKDNAMNWYLYLSQVQRRTLHNGSLYVVSGTTKAASWGLFVIDDVPGAPGTSVMFKPSHLNPSVYYWTAPGLGVPKARAADDGFRDIKNQAVFITGFQISLGTRWYDFFNLAPPEGVNVSRIEKNGLSKVSEWVPFSVHSGGGGRGRPTGQSPEPSSNNSPAAASSNASSNSSATQSFDPSNNVSSTPEHSTQFNGSCLADISEMKSAALYQAFHPADEIHEYIRATFPTCDIVVTHDSHWISILEDADKIFPDSTELHDRLVRKYQPVLSAGTASLQLLHNDHENIGFPSQKTMARNIQQVLPESVYRTPPPSRKTTLDKFK
ncbi:hypothetical protein DFH06DRAFT_1160054 [Mycena polygramma]|nr:hypothetical protein DFH06DRAFT_1160054 [Mycena polygramma]